MNKFPPLYKAFTKEMAAILGPRPPRQLGLSVSGGVDSMALASLTAEWAAPRGIDLRAFVLNHGLRAGSADEAHAVSNYLTDELRVPSSVIKLGLDPDVKRVEEAARHARRSALDAECARYSISNVLLGHHMDDQIELFIQRLLNGSTWFGLAGMAAISALHPQITPGSGEQVRLVRPLLTFRKAQLIDWCRSQQIPWWEDHTNADINLTQRNAIRRLYALGKEPPAFAPDQLAPLITYLGERRRHVEVTAGLVYAQLRVKKLISLNEGRAAITLTPEMRALPTAVLGELLLRVLAPVSPAKDSTLFTRRRRLDELAIDVKKSLSSKQTLFGLVVEIKDGELNAQRERPRRIEQATPEIFMATSHWSSWTIIDNRWWFRWRLNPAAMRVAKDAAIKQNGTRYFSVRILPKVDALLAAIGRSVPSRFRTKLSEVVTDHPFFMWSDDPKNPDVITDENAIGFPSAGFVRGGLEVEVKPKAYTFDML